MSVARAGSCKFEPPKRSTGRTKLRVKYTFMDAHQPLFKRRSSAASLIQRCFRGFTVRRAWRHRISRRRVRQQPPPVENELTRLLSLHGISETDRVLQQVVLWLPFTNGQGSSNQSI